MKKIFFIAFMGLVFSCQKEEIKPLVLPEGEHVTLTDKSRTPMSTNEGQDSEGGSTGTGTITDPNSDRDANSRKRN